MLDCLFQEREYVVEWKTDEEKIVKTREQNR